MYNYSTGYYQPYTQQPQQMPQAAQPAQSSITWVQGLAAAKSYPVAPATSVLLMDSEESRFYIKSSDVSGMPLPLRVFEYKEATEPTKAPAGAVTADGHYVTHEELNALEQRIKAEINGLKGGSSDE